VRIVSLGSEDNPMNAYESWDGQPLSKELEERFELHYGKHSRQYKWLIKDLSSVDRRVVPWVVVFTHRPLYSTANHHPNCKPGGDWFVCKFRDTYEPVFRQFGVDLVVSGHSHHYSRSVPMFKGKAEADRGIVHVVLGTGGFELTGNAFQPAGWVAARQGTQFGYVRMVVTNSTHAKWSYILKGGKVFEQVWLVRNNA
jgi:acid phosphatase